MDQQLITEAFDSKADIGINLQPKSKVPQFFMIDSENVSRLVVRMFARTATGYRSLKTTDRDIVVFIYTLNEKGNLSQLRGGLGVNPFQTILSIFQTAWQNLDHQKIDSICFVFPAKKLAGREKIIQTVFDRLLKQNGGSQFTMLDELAQFSQADAYFMVQRKSIDPLNLVGTSKDHKQFTKVDTKAGEVFVNKENGDTYSNAEVAASEIADSLNKINKSGIISKSKLSREDLLNSIYPEEIYAAEDYMPMAKKIYNEIRKTSPIILSNSENKFQVKFDLKKLEQSSFIDRVVDVVGVNTGIPEISDNIEGIKQIILDSAKMYNGSNIIQVVSETIKRTVNLTGSKVELEKIVASTVRYIRHDLQEILLKKHLNYNFTDSEIKAIKDYSNNQFSQINNFLLGLESSAAKTMKSYINELDSAFEKGIELEKGTVLYRGQSMNYKMVNRIIDTKTFIFKNYVSTSICPTIFGSDYHVNASSLEFKELKKDDPTSEFLPIRMNVGFMIRGADKIKSIFIGEGLGLYLHELEVLLPRGLVVKVNSVKSNAESALFDVTIVEPDQIDESMSGVEIEQAPSFSSMYQQTSNIQVVDIDDLTSQTLLNIIAGKLVQ